MADEQRDYCWAILLAVLVAGLAAWMLTGCVTTGAKVHLEKELVEPIREEWAAKQAEYDTKDEERDRRVTATLAAASTEITQLNESLTKIQEKETKVEAKLKALETKATEAEERFETVWYWVLGFLGIGGGVAGVKGGTALVRRKKGKGDAGNQREEP